MEQTKANTFSFKHMVTCTVTVDDLSIHLKSGPFIKRDFLLSNVQQFYAYHHTVNANFLCLYINYTADNGKTKKVQLMSGERETGFPALVKELELRLPGKSLNHLSQEEAMKQLKTFNPQGPMVYVILWILTMLILGAYEYPAMVHALDSGLAKASVAEIIEGKDFGTRNITVKGILIDSSVEMTSTYRWDSYKHMYLPMVDNDWRQGDSIRLVLESGEKFLVQQDYNGVIRNVAWEGIDPKIVNFFNTNYSLPVSNHAVLVEINGKYGDWFDRTVPLAIAAFLTIILYITYRNAMRKLRSQAP